MAFAPSPPRIRDLAEAVLRTVSEYEDCTGDPSSQVSARERIRSTTSHLMNELDGPEQSVKNLAREYTGPTALAICLDLSIDKALSKEDGPMPIADLAFSTECSIEILTPVLRLLSKRGLFEEPRERFWQHTTLSRKLQEENFRALLQTILDENYRANAALPQFLQSTYYTPPAPNRTAFNRAFQTDLDFYAYCNTHDPARAERFAKAMLRVTKANDGLLDGISFFQDTSSTCDGLVIDVAGGFGHACFAIAQRYPNVRFIVQDHPTVIEKAKTATPADLDARLTFQERDILSSNLSIPADWQHLPRCFLLKLILHDWSDEHCHRIIRPLVDNIRSQDKIIVIDTVLPEKDPTLSTAISDLLTMSLFGGRHRNFQQFRTLFEEVDPTLTLRTCVEGTWNFDGYVAFEACKLS